MIREAYNAGVRAAFEKHAQKTRALKKLLHAAEHVGHHAAHHKIKHSVLPHAQHAVAPKKVAKRAKK